MKSGDPKSCAGDWLIVMSGAGGRENVYMAE
jgi:hypothetical protein